MLVRAASPPGAFGRVFGIVTTGFNIGGIDRADDRRLDHGSQHAALGVLLRRCLFMALTAAMALAGEWRARRGGRMVRA